MRTTPEWDFPQLRTGARTVISIIYYPWLQVPISRDEEDSNCWPTSPTPQQVQKGIHFPGRREGQGVKLKAPRGVYSAKTSPSESPAVIKSPPPVLRERYKPTQPSPPQKIHMLYKKASTHYRHIRKGTQLCYTKGNSTSDVRCMHFL